MSQEATAGQENENSLPNNNAGSEENVDTLRDKLTSLTWASQSLSNKDKRAILDWLAIDEKSNDTAELKTRINSFNEAEKSVEKQVTKYREQIQNEINEGRFSIKSAKSYEDWFRKDLSYEERQEYLDNKKTDLHNPKRKEIHEVFNGKKEINGVHIPSAVRAEFKYEFIKSDLQEREALVKRIATRHKFLRDNFRKLSPEIQQKYLDQFKAAGLKGREKILKQIIGTNPDAASPGVEKSEEEKLTRAFEEKSAKLVTQDLLTEKSKAAYDTWFDKLPLDQKKTMLNRSELDTRLQDRKNVRDEFNELVPELRRPHEVEFRGSDLDRRKEILQKIAPHEGGKKEAPIKYPDGVIKKMLDVALRDPSLYELRLVHTLLSESQTLRRRAEIVLDTKDTEKMTKKTKEKGFKTDEHVTIDYERVKRHGEDRFSLKRFLVGKKAEGVTAKATNMDLLDRNRADINADQFKELVVNHQKRELVARLVSIASQKLPQADMEQLRKAANHTELALDLHRAAA